MSIPTEGYVRGVWRRLTEDERVESMSRPTIFVASPEIPWRESVPSETCPYCGGQRGPKRTCEGCGAA